MTSKSKKLSAMDALVKSDALKPALSQTSTLSRKAVANLHNGIPVEISPNICRPWKLADRPLAETEHKVELMKTFQSDSVGQLQPIVARPIKDLDDPEIEYEVVCGRVRWMAAKELGIPLQAIVRDLSDQEAYIVMSVENKQRKNISDWAKAKSYQKALEMGIFDTAQQLAEAEEISKSKLSLYLGFAELPDQVVNTFANISKVSYRTGYAIAKVCKASGIEEVVKLIPKIESGEILRDDLDRMQTRIVKAVPPLVKERSEADYATQAHQSGGLVENGNSILDADQTARAESVVNAGEYTSVSKMIDVQNENSMDSASLESKSVSLMEEVADAVVLTTTPSSINGIAKATFETGSQAEPINSSAQERQLKKTFVSSSGRRLFTYNQAARGWLIRINPDISMQIDEDLMLEIGTLIEARLSGSRG